MSLEIILFGYYPYLVAILFIVAGSLRFRRDLLSWRAGSAPVSHIHRLSPFSKIFHVAMLGLLLGHCFGLIVPMSLYGTFGVTADVKQLLAALSGGALGLLGLSGLLYYLYRRLTDPEKRATGSRMDKFVLVFIAVELLLGLASLPVAYSDGGQMVLLSAWARGILTGSPGTAELLGPVSWIIKLHVFVGVTFFLLVPFSHLVHMWTLPLRCLLYPEQVVIER